MHFRTILTASLCNLSILAFVTVPAVAELANVRSLGDTSVLESTVEATEVAPNGEAIDCTKDPRPYYGLEHLPGPDADCEEWLRYDLHYCSSDKNVLRPWLRACEFGSLYGSTFINQETFDAINNSLYYECVDAAYERYGYCHINSAKLRP